MTPSKLYRVFNNGSLWVVIIKDLTLPKDHQTEQVLGLFESKAMARGAAIEHEKHCGNRAYYNIAA